MKKEPLLIRLRKKSNFGVLSILMKIRDIMKIQVTITGLKQSQQKKI